MKTFSAKPLEVKREWYVVDATDKVVGRLAAEIALRLRGKDKPEYTPHVDTGDYIIVVNADKLVMTGAKAEDKKYFRHSGYPGGVYETTFRKMQEKHPGRALEIAVKGCFRRARLAMPCSRSSSFMPAATINTPPSNPNSLRSKK